MFETVRTQRPIVVAATLVLVVGVLFWAQALLVPLAVAVLLSFLLSPVVALLQRHIGRIPAVTLVVVLSFAAIGALGWLLTSQIRTLADDLPRYRSNIRQRIADLRAAGPDGTLEKVQATVSEIAEEVQKPAATPNRRRPQPVTLVPGEGLSSFWGISGALQPVLGALGTAGLVVVLVIFMLLERQQLRNRFIRAFGSGRLAVTTRALDEAGSRISRYLLMQSLINGSFGLGIGIGLFLIGLPYALLWGLLAAVLRFIPYVGPWMAALAPILLGLAVFDDWLRPLSVVGLFLVLELFSNIVLETLLYAGAAGVSEVGLLFAVAFWTWLWGPLGLLLATPLTVCLLVVAKYVPGMEWLVTLMGDQPALSPDLGCYQRLLADDLDEAIEIVQAHDGDSAETLYDAILLPVLAHARRDRAATRISSDDEARIGALTGAILDDLSAETATGPEAAAADDKRVPIRLLGCAAGTESELIALRMLEQILDPRAFALELLPAGAPWSQTVERAREGGFAGICIAALPPSPIAQVRNMCRRIRGHAPGLRIVIGRWGAREIPAEGSQPWKNVGADAVGWTLAETREQLHDLLARPRPADPVPSAA
jgi:predicted PurR-regulated permease PerM